jgi:hypothetical protein
MRVESASVQLFKNGKTLPKILAEVYPEHNWETYRFSRKTSQYWEELFQGNSHVDCLLIEKMMQVN